jgi:hypothetical protein
MDYISNDKKRYSVVIVQNSFVFPTAPGAAVCYPFNTKSDCFLTFYVHMCRNLLEENFIIYWQSEE